MARIRSIHPDACQSERLAAVGPEAERLYWRLLTHCDDDGRCDDNPRLIRGQVVPLLDCDAAAVGAWMQELAEQGLLERYIVGGKGYVQVTQWDRFQHPRKPRKGLRPAPLRDEGGTGAALVRDGYGTSAPPVRLGEEGSGGEGSGGDSPFGGFQGGAASYDDSVDFELGAPAIVRALHARLRAEGGTDGR